MKLLVALLVSTLLVHSLLADGSRRGKEAAAAALGYSNATVYDMSVAKCAGCGALGAWAESLEFLYYHNLVRLARWELPLAWSPRLESYARWWAAQRRGDCALRHSFPEGQFALGENIFWGGVGGAWRPATPSGLGRRGRRLLVRRQRVRGRARVRPLHPDRVARHHLRRLRPRRLRRRRRLHDLQLLPAG